MRRRYFPLAIAAIAIGGITLAYHGPGQQLVRGHLGDLAVPMLLYATISTLGITRRRWTRAALAIAIPTALELGQCLWTGTGMLGELLVGSTFDLWDMAAYVVGTAIALAYDQVVTAYATGVTTIRARTCEPRSTVLTPPAPPTPQAQRSR